MGLLDLYNSIGEGVGKIGDSLSNIFSDNITYNAADYKKQKKNQPSTYHLKDRGVKITDEDLEKFRPLLYGEVSNRDPEKKRLEADVILNTALNRQKEYARRGQNKTIAEILAMPNQYQAYKGKQYQRYANPTDEVAAEKKRQVDAIVDDIKRRVRSGEFKDNTEGAYYYIHNSDGSITYDNLKELFAD